MADNVIPVYGGDTIAADDIAGVKYQRVKVAFGIDGVATDVSAVNPLPVIADDAVSDMPLASALAQPVRQVPNEVWRVSFTDVGSGLLSSNMTTMQTGAGMAITQNTSNLILTTGTTARSETLLRSNRTFRGAINVRHKITLSQRIANANFQVVMADLIGTGLAYTINSATSITVTFPTGTNPFNAMNVGQFLNLSMITTALTLAGRYPIASTSGDTVTFTVSGFPASGTGTLTIWGWNYIRTLYTGTTATNAAWDTQRRGWAAGDTTLTVNSTASPGHVFQSMGNASLMTCSDALVATNAGYQTTPRGSRIENIPDDETPLYLFIQVLNGATAPASSTTMTMGFISVEQTGTNKVFIGGADQNGAPFALNTQGTATVSGTVAVSSAALSAGTNLVGDVGIGFRSTANGQTYARIASAASVNNTIVKSSIGRLYKITVANTTASAKYLKLYNKATAPVAGTDIPVLTILVPAGNTLDIDYPGGRSFSTGIGYALTGAVGDTDTTAVAANDLIGELAYV